MARFRFRLQSYLDIKGKLEEQKKMEFGRAITTLEDEKQKKIEIEDNKNNNLGSLKKSVGNRVDPGMIQVYNNYIELLKKMEIEQQRVVDAAAKKVEEKRQELVEAMKQRKMLEILKDKQHVEFLKEELKAEQKTTDEIVSYRYNKREE